jgi:hypothetical protein
MTFSLDSEVGDLLAASLGASGPPAARQRWRRRLETRCTVFQDRTDERDAGRRITSGR